MVRWVCKPGFARRGIGYSGRASPLLSFWSFLWPWCGLPGNADAKRNVRTRQPGLSLQNCEPASEPETDSPGLVREEPEPTPLEVGLPGLGPAPGDHVMTARIVVAGLLMIVETPQS